MGQASRSRPRRKRRKSGGRSRGSSGKITATGALTLDNNAGKAITSGKGFELLKKMGYTPGQGLGVKSDGASSPVSVTVKRGRAGIGAPEKTLHEEVREYHNIHDDICRPASYPGASPFSGIHWRDALDLQQLTRTLDDVSLLDPLRPACRYDPTHRVPHLKALKKHEAKCPARIVECEEATEGRLSDYSSSEDSSSGDARTIRS